MGGEGGWLKVGAEVWVGARGKAGLEAGGGAWLEAGKTWIEAAGKAWLAAGREWEEA